MSRSAVKANDKPLPAELWNRYIREHLTQMVMHHIKEFEDDRKLIISDFDGDEEWKHLAEWISEQIETLKKALADPRLE